MSASSSLQQQQRHKKNYQQASSSSSSSDDSKVQEETNYQASGLQLLPHAQRGANRVQQNYSTVMQ
jgi:hypothetical protein